MSRCIRCTTVRGPAGVRRGLRATLDHPGEILLPTPEGHYRSDSRGDTPQDGDEYSEVRGEIDVNGVAEVIGLIAAHEPGEKETALIEHGEYGHDKRRNPPGPLTVSRSGQHDDAERGKYHAEECCRFLGRRVHRVEVWLRGR